MKTSNETKVNKQDKLLNLTFAEINQFVIIYKRGG